MDSSAIESIKNLAVDANIRRLPEALDDVAVALPKEYSLHSLEKFYPNRTRFRGRYTTSSMADFIAYTKANDSGSVFASADDDLDLSATAFFNLGDTDEPGHADWIAHLSLVRTAAFNALIGTGSPFSQATLIELIEDWEANIRAFDGPEEPGDGVTLGKAISAIRKIKIAAKSEAESTRQNFGETTSRLDSVSVSSEAGLPAFLSFKFVPFLGFNQREVFLRLSVSTDPNRPPTLKLRPIGWEQVIESIQTEFKTRLIEEIGDKAKVHIGTFAP